MIIESRPSYTRRVLVSYSTTGLNSTAHLLSGNNKQQPEIKHCACQKRKTNRDNGSLSFTYMYMYRIQSVGRVLRISWDYVQSGGWVDAFNYSQKVQTAESVNHFKDSTVQ